MNSLRRIIFYPLVFVFLLAACSAPNPDQLAATVQHIAATGVQLTLQALPISTLIPSATFAATMQPSATAATLAAVAPTATQFAGQGTLANGLPTELSATEKANKSDNSTVLFLQNNTDEVIWLIIDSPTYFEYRFSDSFAILLPIGEYHYRVWIGDKGPHEGTFRIGNHDKHTMIFSAGKVQFLGP